MDVCYVCKCLLNKNYKNTVCEKAECKLYIENLVVGNYVVNKIILNNNIILFTLKLILHACLDLKLLNPYPIFLQKNQESINIISNACKYLTSDSFKKIVGLIKDKTIPDDVKLCELIGEINYKILKFAVITNKNIFTGIFCSSLDLKSKNKYILYKINNNNFETEFNNERGNKHTIKYLYHGSNIQNWYSILNIGIKNLSGTCLMRNGQLHGGGVYLGKTLATSKKYSTGKVCIIAIVELITDNNFIYNGCDCYVVSNDKLIIIRYLLIINQKTENIDFINSFENELKNVLDYNI